MTVLPISNHSEEIKEMTRKLHMILNSLKVQNDLIDYVPSVDQVTPEEALSRYDMLNKTLGNIYYLNDSLIQELDDVLVSLYDIQDELNDLEEE